MAGNTRFKTENGLVVSGGNSVLGELYTTANATVGGDLLLVQGDFTVLGNYVIGGTTQYITNLEAGADNLNIANSTYQFNAYLKNVYVNNGIFALSTTNSTPLGSSTGRFAVFANSVNASGNVNVTGNINAASINIGTSFSANQLLTVSPSLNVTGTINATALNITNQTNTGTLNATTSANVGSNVQISTSQFVITGNSTTAPTTILGSTFSIGNSTVTATPSFTIANSSGNATARIGSLSLSNSTVNFFTANQTLVVAPNINTTQANATSTDIATKLSVGSGATNVVVNTSAVTIGTGSVATLVNTSVINTVSGVFLANVYVGNSTAGVLANNISLSISNTTGNLQQTPVSIVVSNSTSTAFTANLTSVYHVSGFISNNFVKAQKIVAPTPIINKGTGLLTSIGASISLSVGFGNPVVDPTGRFLYAPATTTTVGQYSINQSTGALTSIAAVADGNGVRGIAVDPTGRFVYVCNHTDGTVSQFSIDQSTGELASIATAIATGTTPQGLAVDPTGRFVYVCAGGSVYQYSISQSTGELTLIGSVSQSLAYSIAVDPTGRFVYVVTNNSTGNISVYSINQSTGALTIVGSSTSIANSPTHLAIDPSGRFVYVTREAGNLVSQFSIDQNTGAVTLIGAVATGNSPQRVAISPNGLYAYITNVTDSTIQQYSINQYTGVLASLGTVSVTSARAITTDSTGRFVYATSASELYSFLVNNLSAGSVTIAGSLTSSSNSLTLGTSSIASSGYSRLPNGLLMQWGNILANSTTASFNYPTTFSALYSTQATASNSTYHVTYTAQLITVGVSGMTIRTANSASTTVYWSAIGV